MKSKSSIAWALVLGLSAGTVGCSATLAGGGGGGGGGGGTAPRRRANEGRVNPSCLGDYGASAVAQNLETFLGASADFANTSFELEATLNSTCRRMAADLQIPEGELAPASPDVPPVRAACERVARQIHDDMAAVRAAANARVVVSSTPPTCRVSVDAYAQCVGQCDASFNPGSAQMQCEGGEIRGRCSGQCTGRCAVDVNGQCSARCEGTCSGSCTGVCQGTCEGTCAVRAADGSCNGACQGTCRGSCSAGCTGTCQGKCELSAQASCQGECRGGCSVQWTEPYCTGRVVPPSANADCRASCDARFSAQMQCEPGQTSVNVQGVNAADLAARSQRLATALQNGMPTIRAVAEKLQRLHNTSQAIIDSGARLAGSIGMLGIQASVCVAEATSALPQASVRVDVSIQVSASVSGSVGTQ